MNTLNVHAVSLTPIFLCIYAPTHSTHTPHTTHTPRPSDVALMLLADLGKVFGCAVEHVGREYVVLKVSSAAKEQW